MRHTVHAEWTKLRTLHSTAWLLLTIAVLTVIASVTALAGADAARCPSPAECFEDTPKLSLSGVWLGQAAVVVLAVLTASGEFGTGTIKLTLAATPRRARVLLAKAAVLSGLVLAAGALGVLASLLAGRLILPGQGFTGANGYPPLSLADGPTLRAAVGSVLYLALVALLALGVATVVRDGAGGITAMLALLYLVPIFGPLLSEDWYERLQKAAPMSAGLAVQATERLEQLPIGPWPGLAVLAGYAAAALVLGWLALAFRDV
ncbi:ABC transporter permease subunit [Actinomadura hibisca]|uniref:ABC transporter permease subunit n=1 Tax=Actinomadura hibisca TaxID=68565 RepID=UPI000A70EC21|nr:ABC transporter permease subunit [Actinomadura hibisca]